eukprot:3475640-Rhodomonas_salina.1
MALQLAILGEFDWMSEIPEPDRASKSDLETLHPNPAAGKEEVTVETMLRDMTRELPYQPAELTSLADKIIVTPGATVAENRRTVLRKATALGMYQSLLVNLDKLKLACGDEKFSQKWQMFKEVCSKRGLLLAKSGDINKIEIKERVCWCLALCDLVRNGNSGATQTQEQQQSATQTQLEKMSTCLDMDADRDKLPVVIRSYLVQAFGEEIAWTLTFSELLCLCLSSARLKDEKMTLVVNKAQKLQDVRAKLAKAYKGVEKVSSDERRRRELRRQCELVRTEAFETLLSDVVHWRLILLGLAEREWCDSEGDETNNFAI